MITDKDKSSVRQGIYAWARGNGETFDFTCEETEIALNIPHGICSAHFTRMKELSTIVPTGLSRPTRAGKYAKVFRIAPEPIAKKPWRNIPFDSPEWEETLKRERHLYCETEET